MQSKDSFEQALSAIGLDSRSYTALLLMPVIYVAWADRQITRWERINVWHIARRELKLSAEALAVVERWLTRPPTRREYGVAFDALLRLAAAPDEWLVDVSQFPDLVAFAETVATSTGEGLGQPLQIGARERAALDEVERLLGVDMGARWADLITEMGGVDELPAPMLRVQPEL